MLFNLTIVKIHQSKDKNSFVEILVVLRISDCVNTCRWYWSIQKRNFSYCTARQQPAQNASTQRHGKPDIWETGIWEWNLHVLFVILSVASNSQLDSKALFPRTKKSTPNFSTTLVYISNFIKTIDMELKPSFSLIFFPCEAYHCNMSL